MTSMEDIETCYISSGCNRTPHCAAWSKNGLICFGSCKAIAIYRPELHDNQKTGAVLQTLTSHKDKVNCVKWLETEKDDEAEIVSGSVDKTVIVWKKIQDKYERRQVLVGHSGPVTALCGAYVPVKTDQGRQLRAVLATASADSSVKIWSRQSDEEFKEVGSLSYGSGFALDLAMVLVPDTDCLMLACATDDHKVHVYIEEARETGKQQFVPVITLPGHEDWVRAVDFTIDDTGDVLLASAAQDYMIRVWRFSSRQEDTGKRVESVLDLPLDTDIQMRENTFTFTHNDQPVVYAVSLETVLSGHENWIYSVKWKPKTYTGGKPSQEMCLLSVSMDKTMILWQPDTESGVWMEQVRMGEVGGNTLGLYGGMFSPDGNSILGHGYQGAFHHWTFNQAAGSWDHVVTASGHFDSVEDIDWDRKGGNFLLSCSLDETVRLHAPWVKENREVFWYEIARPQIHGYPLHCLAMVTRYQYASGADEKVVRVFDAPNNFVENFCSLCGKDLEQEKQSEEAKNRPVGASVPALGLSNKAVFSDKGTDLTVDLEIKPGDSDQYSDNVFTQVSLTAPPSEEHLLQNTLWPEVQKLYGHGYEIFTMACDPQGKVLATSCKASKAEFASVILWDTESWKQVCTLDGPSLTVTQLTFSHTGEYLLSVSRDRTWFLYRRKSHEDTESEPLFRCVASLKKGAGKKALVHSRIIWSCCWTPDDQFFMTASRDKTVLVWPCPTEATASVTAVSKLEVPDSATAIDVAPTQLTDASYLVSIGLDSGEILFYRWYPDDSLSWQQITSLSNNIVHHLTVKRLKFRPCLGLAGIHGNKNKPEAKDGDEWQQLASCGADHAVKIYNLYLPKMATNS